MMTRIMLLFIRMFTRRERGKVTADPESGTAKTVEFVADDAGNVASAPDKTVEAPIPDPGVTIHVPAVDSVKKLYQDALALVLKFEGGYVNDPDDPGGETNKGIIKTVYDKYRQQKNLPVRSVRDITEEEVGDIYAANYWDAGKCGQLPPRLAVVHFDSCVNVGVTQAAKFLQRSLGVKDDGKVGSDTLSAARLADENKVVIVYLEKRRAFYRYLADSKPKLVKFLKGWLKRVDQLEDFVSHMNP